MVDIPYLSNTGKMKKFFNGMVTIAVPNVKVTTTYIESLGYKSKGDRGIMKVLSFLGFIDSDKKPTQAWKDYRNREKGPAILSNAIKSAYKVLYDTYPDAHQKDDEALRNLLSSHTDVGEGALSYMVGTFKALVDLSDFKAGEMIKDNGKNNEENSGNGSGGRSGKSHNISKELVININIQLQLPDSADSETFDKFFQALKKHLLEE